MTRFPELGDCVSYVEVTRFQNLDCDNEIYPVKFKTPLGCEKKLRIACAALGAGNACNCGRLKWKVLMGNVMSIYDELNVNNLEIKRIA
jgi:hypothetical protein